MELTNFQEKIQALESAEDLIGLGRDASELRQEFEDFINYREILRKCTG